MARPAKFSDQGILDAAAAIAAGRGPAAATMTAIGAALGAPNASLYHRFRSRDELLGRLWLQKAAAFQDRFAQAAALDDAREAGLAAALSMPRSVRADPQGARILLLHRREDFMSEGWPSDMTEESLRLASQVKTVLATMTRRLFGSAKASDRQASTFVLLDVPFAAVRRHVGMDEAPPPQVDALIATVFEAVVDGRRLPSPARSAALPRRRAPSLRARSGTSR